MNAPWEKLHTSLAGRYELREEIGRGMAVVYAARDLRHDRPVAIKFLSDEASASRGSERFQREIHIAAALNHPHILPLFDSGEIDGRLYFVMPLVRGETLRQRLRRESRLSVDDALRIAREIAEALAHAHDAGIIHRDVKPENILLAHGHALLADFGIARAPAGGDGDALTVTGVVVGTPEYMSPEQLLGDDSIGPAADVYALGCVLYEMLTGASPHHGARLEALVASRLAPPPSIRRSRPELTVSIERAITRTLAARPGDRFQSAREFAAALTVASSTNARVAADHSLVVRPFDAVGDDAGLAFFTDGITEEVIGDLSKVRSLRVISRTSAMRLKGSAQDVRAIARDYDVRYVVSGSVRSAGDRVRIATEIVDAMLDAPVWAGKFDGFTTDPFSIQELVARGVVEALRVSLSPEEQRVLADRPIGDPRAHECYRRAMAGIVDFSREGLGRAGALLEEGLAIVGDNAHLFAAMGSLHWQWVNAGFDVSEERVARARHWLDRAMELDPELADAHLGMAWIAGSRGQNPAALRHLDRALASEPNHALALAMYAVFDWVLGRPEHLRQTLQHLRSIDPWELWGVLLSAWECALRGDRAERERWCGLAFEISQTPVVSFLHGMLRAQDGEREAARDPWVRGLRDSEDDFFALLCRAGVAGLDGDQASVKKWLDRPVAQSLADHDAQWAWHIAEVSALAGLPDLAMGFLERAVRQGFSNTLMLESRDATLAAVRSHARFPELLEATRQNATVLEAALGRPGPTDLSPTA